MDLCPWCNNPENDHDPGCISLSFGNANRPSALSAGLDAHVLKEQLDKLLCVVNAVTCPHRHGQPVRPKDLTRLANRQIEVEEALREMGN